MALALPGDLSAHIDARTRDGSVRSMFPLYDTRSSCAEGDVNGGGRPIASPQRSSSRPA